MKKNNFVLLLLAFFLVLLPSSVYANKAGLVVRKSTGEIKTACVEFSQTFISGENLLEMSGLNPVFENKFLVEIDGERSKGHEYLADDDSYWSYWIYNSTWKYANSGATYTKVYDKAVHGWQFAQSKLLIPPASFDDICTQPAATQEVSTVTTEEINQTMDSPTTSSLIDSANHNEPDQISVTSEITKPNTISNNSIAQNFKKQPVNTLNLSVNKSFDQNIFEFSLKNALVVICGFLILGFSLFGIKFFIHYYKKSHLK